MYYRIIIKLAHKTESENIELSHQLLDSYNEIRSLSHQLNNTSIDGEMFINRLLDVFPENSENNTFHHQITPISLTLKEPFSTHIYRIIQELMTNNLKHSKATITSVDVTLEDSILKLNYTDNGIGNKNPTHGNGLKNIKDRVLLMNGNLDINSDTGNGFSVQIKIPYTS